MPNPLVPDITESTLLMGDSNTVGTLAFVKVAPGVLKDSIAVGGKTSAWLLQQAQAYPNFPSFKNVVMLIGTNDIGSSYTASTTFKNIEDTWKILKQNGCRVFACTIPPVKGWSGFMAISPTFYDQTNAKRKDINARIMASDIPDAVIRYDMMTADPSDPDALSDYYNSGDHLHLTKTRLGTLITAAVTGTLSLLVPPAVPPGFIAPSAPPSTPSSPGPAFAWATQNTVSSDTWLLGAGAVSLLLLAGYHFKWFSSWKLPLKLLRK